MRHFWLLCLPLVCLASCANTADEHSPGENRRDPSSTKQNPKPNGSSKVLTSEQARELIPKAASLSQQEFQSILEEPPVELGDIENQSLTALLLAIEPDHALKQNARSRRKFHYAGSPFLKPDSELLKAAVQGDSDPSYVSLIQPEYITGCTCLTRGNTANGQVMFRADSLYSGEANFTAHRIENEWQIVAFNIPEYGLLTERQPDGKWKLYSEDSLLGIEFP